MKEKEKMKEKKKQKNKKKQKEKKKTSTAGYIRCNYFILIYCTIIFVIIWWLFGLKIGQIRRQKITGDGPTNGPTDGWTDGRTEGHDLL